ncbi:MAG TPA: SCP2 sterol-binding domain-containing protein [bacterium]|nr:SCP2 sterol-binding domain-containing protein [bacterium]
MSKTAAEVFQDISAKLTADPAKVAGINAVYQFSITGDGGGEWNVDLTGEAPKVSDGAHENANCTVTMTDEDFMGIIDGSLNAQMAFLQGKVKIQGDMSLAMKLQKILG